MLLTALTLTKAPADPLFPVPPAPSAPLPNPPPPPPAPSPPPPEALPPMPPPPLRNWSPRVKPTDPPTALLLENVTPLSVTAGALSPCAASAPVPDESAPP
ncbi:hypothetical protein DB345_06325 [Spartobacteria bacterium LR76]|nr:hypothetical protein DB345_06325 [Spartobacteria bacterium LR76]